MFKIEYLPTGIRDKRSYDWIHLMKTYKKYARNKHITLEIGASNEERTLQLARHCKKLIGVEVMPERKPKDYENIEYRLGNWETLSEIVENNSVDVAVACHVLEHIEQDKKALDELYKVMKKGSAAILTTPNRNRPASKTEEFFKGKKKFPWHEHFREYTEEDLVSLIEKTSFNKYKIEPVTIGITGWKLFIYFHPVPEKLRYLCGFWQVVLFK